MHPNAQTPEASTEVAFAWSPPIPNMVCFAQRAGTEVLKFRKTFQRAGNLVVSLIKDRFKFCSIEKTSS